MLLRYLIVIEKSLIDNFDKEISDFFVKYLSSINDNNKKKLINIKNKRLNAEIKLLNSNSFVNSVNIIDELTNWKI